MSSLIHRLLAEEDKTRELIGRIGLIASAVLIALTVAARLFLK